MFNVQINLDAEETQARQFIQAEMKQISSCKVGSHFGPYSYSLWSSRNGPLAFQKTSMLTSVTGLFRCYNENLFGFFCMLLFSQFVGVEEFFLHF